MTSFMAPPQNFGGWTPATAGIPTNAAPVQDFRAPPMTAELDTSSSYTSTPTDTINSQNQSDPSNWGFKPSDKTYVPTDYTVPNVVVSTTPIVPVQATVAASFNT